MATDMKSLPRLAVSLQQRNTEPSQLQRALNWFQALLEPSESHNYPTIPTQQQQHHHHHLPKETARSFQNDPKDASPPRLPFVPTGAFFRRDRRSPGCGPFQQRSAATSGTRRNRRCLATWVRKERTCQNRASAAAERSARKWGESTRDVR